MVKEYTLKSKYVKMGLRAKFLGMKCTDKGGVREFLEGLWLKKEELCQAGVEIEENDYFSVIISSLSAAMVNFALSQLAAAHFSLTKTITSNDLISMLIEEADRQKVQFAQYKGSGKGKDDDSEVLAEGESLSGKKQREEKNIKCWNCGKKGHFNNKCPDPKVDKNLKGKLSENTTNSVASDEEGALAAEEVVESDWFSLDDVEVEIEAESCKEVVELGDTLVALTQPNLVRWLNSMIPGAQIISPHIMTTSRTSRTLSHRHSKLQINRHSV